ASRRGACRRGYTWYSSSPLARATTANGPLYGGAAAGAATGPAGGGPPGVLVPQVPSLPLWTQTEVSVRTDSGALARSSCAPDAVKVTVACPPPSALATAAAPVMVAPAA